MKGEALRVPPPKVSCYKAESAVISNTGREEREEKIRARHSVARLTPSSKRY